MYYFEKTFAAMEALLGVAVSLHDHTGVFRDHQGQNLVPAQRMRHPYPCCPDGDPKRCLQDCPSNTAEKTKRNPVVKKCRNGIHEVVVPIFKNKAHLATLFVGPFLPKKGPQPEKLPKDLNPKEASAQDLKDLIRVLAIFAEGLLTRLDRALANSKEDSGRQDQILRFLRYHAHQDIQLPDLAQTLHLSESRTSHVVKELFGKSFKRLLLEERLARARILLLTHTLPVSAVGRQVGFSDEFHFNASFKKAYGVPPGQFRKKNEAGKKD